MEFDGLFDHSSGHVGPSYYRNFGRVRSNNDTDWATALAHEAQPDYQIMPRSQRLIIAAFYICSVVFNVMVFVAITSSRRLRTRTNALVANHVLAGALDGCVLTVTNFFKAFPERHWIDESAKVCKIYFATRQFFTTFPITMLTIMAVHRFQSVFLPMPYSRINLIGVTTRVALSWCIPLVFSFFPVIADWESNDKSFTNPNYPHRGLASCLLIRKPHFKKAHMTITYITPALFAIAVLLLTEYKVSKKIKQNLLKSKLTKEAFLLRKRHHLVYDDMNAVPLLVLMLVHTICWSPFHVLAILFPDDSKEGQLRPYLAWLGHAYYTAAPFILYLTNRGLRAVILFQVLRCRCVASKNFVVGPRHSAKKIYKSGNISGIFVSAFMTRRSTFFRSPHPSIFGSHRSRSAAPPKPEHLTPPKNEQFEPKAGTSLLPGTSTLHTKLGSIKPLPGKPRSPWNRVELARVRALPRRLCRRSLSAKNCLLIGANFGREDLFKI